jgi:hypothetical protein
MVTDDGTTEFAAIDQECAGMLEHCAFVQLATLAAAIALETHGWGDGFNTLAL